MNQFESKVFEFDRTQKAGFRRFPKKGYYKILSFGESFQELFENAVVVEIDLSTNQIWSECGLGQTRGRVRATCEQALANFWVKVRTA